jgi:hypothetical protein
VAELKALSTKWKGLVISPAVNEHVSALLRDISDLIAESKPYEPSPEWLRPLARDAIFPVEVPKKGLILRACNDHFYVPDRSGRYRAVFGRDIPLLSLGAPVTLHEIKPILDSSYFGSCIRLEQAVKRVALPNGPRDEDVSIRDKYASRYEFLER